MTTSNKPSAALAGHMGEHMGEHMGQKTGVKPIARLDGSLLLARKGEAAPSVAATQHNNPALAWGAPAHPADYQPQTAPAQPVAAPASQKPVASARLRPDSFQGGAFAAHGRGATAYPQHPSSHSTPRVRAPLNQQRDPVALTMRVEDETYLRLKYLAQHTGRSAQQVLAEALEGHLTDNGVPRSRKLVITSQ